MPAVSVIIPTFNRADLIGDAIRSVLQQTCDDCEIVVVDDGSTDATRTVINSFTGPIRYLYQDNRGRSAARNWGFLEAAGQYVLFLDSDDLLLPSALEILLGVVRANPDIGVAYSNGFHCDAQGRPIQLVDNGHGQNDLDASVPLIDRLALRNVIGPIHGALIRRDWLEHVAPCFDESLSVLEDADLWFRLAAAGCPFLHLDEVTCLYRIHGENTISSGRPISQPHWESYLNSRRRIFYSATFLTLLPSVQMTFLHTALIDRDHGDEDLRSEFLGSEQFARLPYPVQARILYLAAVDRLLTSGPGSDEKAWLATAIVRSPFAARFRLARALVDIDYRLLVVPIRTFRQLRSTRRSCAGAMAGWLAKSRKMSQSQMGKT